MPSRSSLQRLAIACCVLPLLSTASCNTPLFAPVLDSCDSGHACPPGYGCHSGHCTLGALDAADRPRDAAARDAGSGDASRSDGARPDTAQTDAAQADGAQADGAQADSAQADGAQADSAQADGAQADSAQADAAAPDAAQRDAGAADIGAPEAGSTDAESPDTPRPDAGVCQNGALEFSAAQYADIPDHPSLDNLNAISIEAWIYPTAIGSNMMIASHHDHGSEQGWALYINSSGRLSFSMYDGSSWKRAPGDADVGHLLARDTWYHVAGTYDGDVMRVFVNGALQAISDYDLFQSADFDGPLRIGGAASGGSGFVGVIDEVHLRRVPQHSANFVVPLGAQTHTATTIGLWHLDGSGQLVEEASGQLDPGRLGSTYTEDATDPSRVSPPCLEAIHPGEVSCDFIFGSAIDYEGCDQTDQQCTFFSDYNSGDPTCAERCAMFGSSCVDGFEEAGSSGCVQQSPEGCQGDDDSLICVCTRP